jgi:hypothetical protein
MSPHVELDDEVFDHLKAHAEPFVDTPNDVIRRLLGLAGAATTDASSRYDGDAEQRTDPPRPPQKAAAKAAKKRGNKASPAKRPRAASGSLLPEQRYNRPLLQALVDLDGQAPYREVVDAVGRELKDDLLPADYETLTSGSVRWQSRLQFVRLRLIERGYLDKNSPRGVWAITDDGREALSNPEEL